MILIAFPIFQQKDPYASKLLCMVSASVIHAELKL